MLCDRQGNGVMRLGGGRPVARQRSLIVCSMLQ